MIRCIYIIGNFKVTLTKFGEVSLKTEYLGKYTSPELVYDDKTKSVVLDFSTVRDIVKIEDVNVLVNEIEHAVDVGDYIEKNIDNLLAV